MLCGERKECPSSALSRLGYSACDFTCPICEMGQDSQLLDCCEDWLFIEQVLKGYCLRAKLCSRKRDSCELDAGSVRMKLPLSWSRQPRDKQKRKTGCPFPLG